MQVLAFFLVVMNMGLGVFCFIHLFKAIYFLFSDYKKFVKNLLLFFLLFALSILFFNVLASNAEFLQFEIIKPNQEM
ncbi:conserved hypothetical protein [Vibrio nigripulchritudo SFn27]|uniref:Uncharacterized protein n=1 Tax=Vibrio nigripulchritudo TaxID=28173 RepID=U4KI19_9VIBR|nr:conserved hypothetical protein [Vibrio nigripulchritudo BLFn1]CCN89260.1 conserved hypothetical protein [Vibrio nigripulchritudo SFn27]CCO40384.1 conserved hypothetical protein [Vibrio nigripulchritudo SFn135]CCO55671.1 conserved hypothetical protein [Vibrio nigripulchritudo Wn13]CCO61729.1 conserved hypothetical protein [Vibrio nigripulchritudo]